MKYKKHILLNLLLGLFLLAPLSVTAATSQPIAAKAVTVLTTKSTQTYIDNYYSTVNLNLTGEALKAALETRLLSERGRYFTYSNMQYDAFPYTDVDPLRPNGGYIVSFYSGTPVYGYTGMNKEHTWPNSHGGRMIENDPHMVRPTLIQENSTRGNEYYAQAPNIGWDPAELGNEKYRGMSARVALYGAVIGHSKGLILEDVGRGEGTGTGNRMGKLGDLLKWNLQYPVDISEIIRNETLDISLNYNRNPFIDDPSLACKIFSETTENTQSICSAQAVAPTSLSISPNSFNLNMGSTQALSVASVPTNATRTVTWTSSNNNIAMVNNGIVTPLAVGNATITATSTLNSAVKTTANVTVTNIPIAVTGISLDKEQVTLGLDTTSQLNATVAPSDASNQNVGWTSSNNNIATVSNNGLISAIALGNAVITATTVDGGFIDSVSVNVVQNSINSVIGSLYNNTTDNSTSSLGINADNLNKGLPSYAAVGFASKQVLSSATDTNSYFPRGGGLAIGSSGSGGQMTLTFNSSYFVTKIELRFNSGAKGNGFTTLTTSDVATVTKIQTGTLGTAYSNPSDANPYIYEFSQAVSDVTISTSIRTILVEVVVYYMEEDTSYQDASNWASAFLIATSEGCNLKSLSSLQTVWNSQRSTYYSLSGSATQTIINTIANGDGTVLEEALARYILIVQKYGLEAFIDGYETTKLQRSVSSSGETNFQTYLLFSTLALGSLISYFYFLKKTK